jgi:hypothetical protein
MRGTSSGSRVDTNAALLARPHSEVMSVGSRVPTNDALIRSLGVAR